MNVIDRLTILSITLQFGIISKNLNMAKFELSQGKHKVYSHSKNNYFQQNLNFNFRFYNAITQFCTTYLSFYFSPYLHLYILLYPDLAKSSIVPIVQSSVSFKSTVTKRMIRKCARKRESERERVKTRNRELVTKALSRTRTY